MQAIETRFRPATNHHGARILVRCQQSKRHFMWQDDLDVPGNHRRAAMIFARMRGWDGAWEGGENYDGTGYTFVNVTRSTNGFVVMPVGAEVSDERKSA